MLGQEFYHEHLRRYIVVFGTMFNNIVVTRRDAAGAIDKRIKVPLSYSPRDKLLARIETDPDLTMPTAITLPRMGFEMNSMTYAGERKLKTIGRHTAKDTGGANNMSLAYNPVPYDINFTLSIMVKNAEDGTQILEQILPFFTPEWTNTVNLVDGLDLTLDIPIVLLSVSSDDTYDGDFETRRALIWTLDFTMKAYLFGPVQSKKVIKMANVNFFIDGFDTEIGAANTAVERFTIVPGLIPTANLAGTISTVNNVVTGVGTSFTTDFITGNFLKVGSVFKQVVSIANNTSMVVASAFATNLVANTYQSTYNGTPTNDPALSIDREFIMVTDNWGQIVTIEDV